jgi:hypothetical protein
MKRLRLQALMGFLLAALICSPAWGAIPPQPGTINYIEGQSSIGGHALGDNSAGSVRLQAGQVLSTQNGRAEVLLTPGVFFRISNNSSADMISPDLANTILLLQKGRALVEVADIRPENNIRINVKGASARLLKPGLYDIDADHGQIRVFDGKAVVQTNGRQIDLKGQRELNLNTQAALKARKFDRKAYQDDFYRWASLRSSYLADANVDAAKRYAGGGGWSPGVWADAGWYWIRGLTPTHLSQAMGCSTVLLDGAITLHGSRLVRRATDTSAASDIILGQAIARLMVRGTDSPDTPRISAEIASVPVALVAYTEEGVSTAVRVASAAAAVASAALAVACMAAEASAEVGTAFMAVAADTAEGVEDTVNKTSPRRRSAEVSSGKSLEARIGVEPTNKGFADLSRTLRTPRLPRMSGASSGAAPGADGRLLRPGPKSVVPAWQIQAMTSRRGWHGQA